MATGDLGDWKQMGCLDRGSFRPRMRTTDAWHEKTLEAERLAQVAEIQEELGTVAQIVTDPRKQVTSQSNLKQLNWRKL